MGDASYDLTTLKDFTAAHYSGKDGVDGLHCPKCSARRRVTMTPRGDRYWVSDAKGGKPPLIQPPASFELTCVQCRSVALAVVFASPAGPDLAILWSVGGGLASPHTPNGVRYYLDQAARSESVGARSAAVAMYRAALEHLLLEQGYTAKMLGPKLKQVDAHIAAGTPKPWARDLATDFMNVFRQLGNASIHADDTDTSKQEGIDAAFLADLHVAMEMLLDLVYERPKREAERLARLRAGVTKLTT